MDAEIIPTARRFNRTVTRRLGLLDADFLKRGRPLGEARMIWEIGAGGADVADLRERLGLDSGYLSRLLRSLERQGLVEVQPAQSDRRRRIAVLTTRGLVERDAYDRLSDDAVRALFAPLPARAQAELARAMETVERMMRAAAVSIAAADPESPDARMCLSAYFAELAVRFENGFDAGAGGNAGDTAMMPPTGVFLVARVDGKPVGCGGWKRLEPGIGEIKRLWVDRPFRGTGLARRILSALEADARTAGIGRLRLDTNRTLTEAHAFYRGAGYREIAAYNDNPYADHWFEKGL